MTDKTKAQLEQELEQTKEALARYKEYMRIVAQKARMNRDTYDVLFNVLRQYKQGLMDER